MNLYLLFLLQLVVTEYVLSALSAPRPRPNANEKGNMQTAIELAEKCFMYRCK